MVSPDDLFRRNFQFARSINYDLRKVHSEDVCYMIRTNAESLLLDEQMLSLVLRSTAAYHLDKAKIQIDNDPNRERHVVDFTVIITSIGSGKSTIFNKLTQATNKREEFEKKRQSPKLSDVGVNNIEEKKKSSNRKNDEKEQCEWTRHAITNDFTGAGIFKSLSETGNILVLVDEFDNEYQKSSLFSIENKSGANSLTSANGLFKSLHTGVDSYTKVRADGPVTLSSPHITILGASNGGVVMEIIRQKLKVSNVPDAMVERFQWEALLAGIKLNATRLVNVSPNSIGLELYFLASSLLMNHTFVFDTDANTKMCNWMDELAIARQRWDLVDSWLSSRLAKSIEQTARIAAAISHIDLTMALLKEFLSTCHINAFGSISFETYCQLADFIQVRYPPQSSTSVSITDTIVDSAIYAMNISIIKYMNLFNINPSCTNPIVEVPMHPPRTLNSSGNPSASNLPATQETLTSETIEATKKRFLDLQKQVMVYPSVSFTRTMLYKNRQLKARTDLLNDLFSSLIEIGLLKEFHAGIITGNHPSTLYIKQLPSTETFNTTNRFTIDLLDQINLAWLLYRPTCTSLLIPAENSVFSEEVEEWLKKDIYQKIIVRKGVYTKMLKVCGHSIQLISTDENRLSSQSTDSIENGTGDTSADIAVSPRISVNPNMPRPLHLNSGGFATVPLQTRTNEYNGTTDNLECNNLEIQQEKPCANVNPNDNQELHDENQFSSNVSSSSRRSSRIRKRQFHVTVSDKTSAKKKMKK